MKNQPPIFCFLIIFIISCSVSDNRTNLAREKLNTSISSGSAGYLKLDNFEKLNGKEIVIMGAKGYVLEFNATAIFQSEAWKREDSWRESFSVYSMGGQGGTLSLMQGYPRHFNKGDQVALTGNAYFEESENGWNVSRIEIINAIITNVGKTNQSSENIDTQKFIGDWEGTKTTPVEFVISKNGNSFVLQVMFTEGELYYPKQNGNMLQFNYSSGNVRIEMVNENTVTWKDNNGVETFTRKK